jgi:hypothetical protein
VPAASLGLCFTYHFWLLKRSNTWNRWQKRKEKDLSYDRRKVKLLARFLALVLSSCVAFAYLIRAGPQSCTYWWTLRSACRIKSKVFKYIFLQRTSPTVGVNVDRISAAVTEGIVPYKFPAALCCTTNKCASRPTDRREQNVRQARGKALVGTSLQYHVM